MEVQILLTTNAILLSALSFFMVKYLNKLDTMRKDIETLKINTALLMERIHRNEI